jgi:hypothetical protein
VHRWIGLFSVAAMLGFAIVSVEACACSSDSIGTGLTGVDLKFPTIECRAWGQVFTAEDTVVAAITIWRTATPTISFSPLHLYVLSVDANGAPNPFTGVILNGPIIMPPGAVDGQPERIEFQLSPPLVLPGRGKYFFALKEDIGAVFTLWGFSTNPYPGGAAWMLGPDVFCGLGFPNEYPGYDLAFEIQYCQEATGVKGASWGQVKSSYRK